MKIFAGAMVAALAIAALSGCASDRYDNNKDRSQLNSDDNRDLPAKVFDLIGRGEETH